MWKRKVQRLRVAREEISCARMVAGIEGRAGQGLEFCYLVLTTAAGLTLAHHARHAAR